MIDIIVYDIVNILLWDGNGKEWEFPHGNGMGMGIIVTKLGMGMGRNGNGLYGNGREWEYEKPFPVISTVHHCSIHVRSAAFSLVSLLSCIKH